MPAVTGATHNKESLQILKSLFLRTLQTTVNDTHLIHSEWTGMC